MAVEVVMFLLAAAALAAPHYRHVTPPELAAHSHTTIASQHSEVDGIWLHVSLREDGVFAMVHNDGDQPVSVDWSTSTVTFGAQAPLGLAISDATTTQIPTTEPVTVKLTAPDLPDGDASSTWALDEAFVLDLRVSRGATDGTHQSTWRVVRDTDALDALEVERAREAAQQRIATFRPTVGVATPVESPRYQAELASIRADKRGAQALWITGIPVGSVGALATLVSTELDDPGATAGSALVLTTGVAMLVGGIHLHKKANARKRALESR